MHFMSKGKNKRVSNFKLPRLIRHISHTSGGRGIKACCACVRVALCEGSPEKIIFTKGFRKGSQKNLIPLEFEVISYHESKFSYWYIYAFSRRWFKSGISNNFLEPSCLVEVGGNSQSHKFEPYYLLVLGIEILLSLPYSQALIHLAELTNLQEVLVQ